MGFPIVGIEAKRLAEENCSGLVLVTPGGELADQAIRDAALWIEPDDLAQIILRVEVPAQSDVRTRANQQERKAFRRLV